MHIGAYGTLIARRLWDDEELQSSRLLPQRRKGRRPLSPDRTDKWLKAVTSRFRVHQDSDEVMSAVGAVNQLGLDLKSGKRCRLK